MKKTAKLLAVLLCVMMAFSVTACNKKPPAPSTTYGLEIGNLTMEVGQNETISAKITPAGTQGLISYEIVTATPTACIRISNGIVSADAVGTATVKATAVNTPAAAETFSVSTTFMVTVTEPAQEEGELVVNGGFENGTYGFTLTPNNEDADTVNYQYSNAVENGASAFNGAHALNLWFDADKSDGVDESLPLDLDVTQSVEVVKDKTYLFSMWFIGNITSITMSVLDGETELVSETFNGYGNKGTDETKGYANLGVEFTAAASKSVTLLINFAGEGGEQCYGYVDDVSLKEGTLDDLFVPELNPEEVYYNAISNPSFTSNADGWTLLNVGNEVGSAIERSGKGLITMYKGKSFKFYTTIANLPELDSYFACMYFEGDGNNYTEAYYYVKDAFDHEYTVDFEPIGYNNGVQKRVLLSDDGDGMTLKGEVEIGVVINYTQTFWCDFDNFALWSEEYEGEDEIDNSSISLENIKVCDISVVNNQVWLNSDNYTALSDQAKNKVSGTLTGATILSASLNTSSNVLSIVIESTEDSTITKTYTVQIIQYATLGDWAELPTTGNIWGGADRNEVASKGSFGSDLWFGHGDEDRGLSGNYTITAKLEGFEAGNYKLNIAYQYKHANIYASVNGTDKTILEKIDSWDSNWDGVDDSVSFTVGADGKIEVSLTFTMAAYSTVGIVWLAIVAE